MKKLLFLLLLPALAFGQKYIEHPLPAKKPYAQVLGYVSYVPSDKKLPLLIALGGYGQNPGNGRSDLYKLMSDGIGDMLRDNNWKQDSFIVVLPQSGSKEYNPKALHNFIEYIKVNYNVDTSRIYITGLSGGANSLYKYLALYRCTAAITISGAGNYKQVCNNQTTKTPLWAFHGELDGVVKPGPDKILIPKYNICIPVDHEHAELTIYPGAGHNVWDRTYANDMIYRWLLFHRSTYK